ncbi:nucleoside transporter C-terminal domain-containing protein [Henriciella sp. AS95]|uniref:NupC/NupG family nucleoside CNT transporter n=1 Tax=Henriciella sp. AS95 TaxID=3135782 RepID=UPI003181177E
MDYSFDNLRSVFGFLLLLAIAWAWSSGRNRIPYRTVAIAIGLQVGFAFIMFTVPFLRTALQSIAAGLGVLLQATGEGTRFAFGYLAGGPAPFDEVNPENNMILAIQILPLMIVVSAIAAILWHWGILEKLCQGIGFVLQRTLGLSGPLGLGTAASIFLGMVEAPMIVRPYLERMSRADIFLVMTAAMATVAGTVMALYITLLQVTIPEAASHVIVASFMAAPAAIAMARIMQPPEPADDAIQKEVPPPKLYQSTMDAFARGVQDGVNVFIFVVGMIVVAVALIALTDIALAAWIPDVDGGPVTTGRLFGWLLAPFMYLLGIPWEDCVDAGRLIGIKMVLNELLAFIDLSAIAEGQLAPRSRVMLIYMLCGFANFGALAIMVGGLSAMCRSRRQDFLDLGLKSMWAGVMANLLNGTLLGIFLT